MGKKNKMIYAATPRLRIARPLARVRQGKVDWYKIRNSIDGPTEVSIYDEIGYFGVTAKDFIRDLSKVEADAITLRLNTPGGEVFDGIAIYNALASHPAKIHVMVDSLAASIGSVIAMAGDTITMAATGTMMIHDGFGMCVGNAAEMRETAELLDKTSDNIASIYADRTGKPAADWRAAMRSETWYSADEAVAAGLADAVAPRKGSPPKNSWNLAIYQTAADLAPATVPDETPDVDDPAFETLRRGVLAALA